MILFLSKSKAVTPPTPGGYVPTYYIIGF